MKYHCQLQSLVNIKSMSDSQGILESKCDSCKRLDCTNPIVFKNVSVLGMNKKMKLYQSASKISLVVQCNGFTEKEDIDAEDKIQF